MTTLYRRGHHSSSLSSSSSSSSSSTSLSFTSPVLANSSFFSLDYFAQPNSPQSSIQAIIKNTTHSHLVQVASYTDNPILSFPSIHPFIYTTTTTPNSPSMTSTPTSTNPNPDNSLACPISPSASSISGSEYYGIGLAAMTASPEPSHSPSTESIQARVLGSPDSDPIDPSPDPDSTTTTDGPKTKLAVHKALVQFPQPTIVNYARPFRGQHQSLQQQQEVPPLPSSTPSPTSPSDDLLPPPNFGVPFDEESFQILTPDRESPPSCSASNVLRAIH